MKKNEIKATLKKMDEIQLPNKDKILLACEEHITTSEVTKINNRSRRTKKRMLLAACMVIVLVMSSFSVYAIASEAKEYKKAVRFFDENDLSTEGLSRKEIKNVYRDITTGKFSYGKTVEVLKQNIGGYEILQADPTPEDLEKLWNSKNGEFFDGRYWVRNSSKNNRGENYKYSEQYVFDEKLGFDVFDKTILTKYHNDELIWSKDIKEVSIVGSEKAGDSIIVYGFTPTIGMERSTLYIIMLDKDGEILWKKQIDSGLDYESIRGVVADEEEIAVFSADIYNLLVVTKLDMEGNIKSSYQNKIGKYAVLDVAKFKDKYLVSLGGDSAHVAMVDNNGELKGNFIYDSEEESYFITDMIEYNDNVYLSAYAFPKLEDGRDAGGRVDIAQVLNYVFEKKLWDISSEELTQLLRDNYTAVLLVCNSEDGEAMEFYEVSGSLGGKLEEEDNKLIWNVESITDSEFSLETSAYSIKANSYIYRYSFNETGDIVSQIKTEDIVTFFR